MLCGAGFLDEAHAAMDLDAERGDLDPGIGRPGFQHRDQHFGACLRGSIADVATVDLSGGVVQQPAHRLGQTAHAQQHAAHIGMVHDRDRRAILRPGAGRLDPLQRIGEGLLRRALGDLHSLRTDIDPRIVHHREHCGEAAILGPDQLPDAFVIVAVGHDAGGRGVDAQLVLQTDAAQVVMRPRRAIVLQMVLGHQQQRDAAAALGRAGEAGENQVDDVLGQLVLAPGDVDLLALDPVLARMLAVFDRLGGGAQCAHVAPGLRLSEVHRARPLAADQIWKIARLLLVRPMRGQRLDRSDREHRQ